MGLDFQCYAKCPPGQFEGIDKYCGSCMKRFRCNDCTALGCNEEKGCEYNLVYKNKYVIAKRRKNGTLN